MNGYQLSVIRRYPKEQISWLNIRRETFLIAGDLFPYLTMWIFVKNNIPFADVFYLLAPTWFVSAWLTKRHQKMVNA